MEIEAKFTLTEPVSAERVEALDWGQYHLGERHTVDQHDTFFDTADRALIQTRHAVRLRAGGASAVVTLKGPATIEQGVHAREEWEEPTTGHDPAAWPDAIRQRLSDLIGAQPIAPLLAVQNRRRTWALLRGDQPIGEVALDEGAIIAGSEQEPMHELEVELKGGTRDDLEAVGRLIQAQLPAQPEDRSKFARGVALLQQSRSTPEAQQ
ncbi:MAG TPA: CYTH domain-containing protein [Herpetosiphonaceae bacterium]